MALIMAVNRHFLWQTHLPYTLKLSSSRRGKTRLPQYLFDPVTRAFCAADADARLAEHFCFVGGGNAWQFKAEARIMWVANTIFSYLNGFNTHVRQIILD